MQFGPAVFTSMRISTRFLTHVLFATVVSCCCAGQQSGVLLGLGDAARSPKYQTLWLYPSGGKVIARQFEGFIVPRNDGFWRLDTIDTCGISRWVGDGIEDTDNDQVKRIDVPIGMEEELVSARVNEVPHVGGTQCDKARELAQRMVKEAREKLKAQRKREADLPVEGEVCESTSMQIHFLNSRYISAETSYNTECGAHPDAVHGWFVKAGEAMNDKHGMKVEEVFGPAGRITFLNGAQKAEEEMKTDPQGDCEVQEPDTSNWIIYHDKSQWRTKGYIRTDRLCGFEREFALDFVPPSSIVGREPSPVNWPLLSHSIANLLDAIASPDGSWGVFLIGPACKGEEKGCDLSRAIAVYELKDGKPGKLLYKTKITPGGEIVMIEWALGKNAERWNKTLREFPAKFPEPVFEGPKQEHK